RAESFLLADFTFLASALARVFFHLVSNARTALAKSASAFAESCSCRALTFAFAASSTALAALSVFTFARATLASASFARFDLALAASLVRATPSALTTFLSAAVLDLVALDFAFATDLRAVATVLL